MTSPTLPDASPFGWLLADSKTGPVPLVRLGDLPRALALKRGLSGIAGLEAMCDCLRQLDAVPTHGYWWAFPDDGDSRMREHADILSRGLELYELRQGYARPVLPDLGRLRSEAWAPGDAVPWGYVEHPGPRPCPWTEFAGVGVEDQTSAHIVWTQPWPEPRQGFAHSWVDRLHIPEHWEHLIDAFGSVDVEGLTYGPGLGPSEFGGGEPMLSFLAMRRDAAEALWPDLFGVVCMGAGPSMQAGGEVVRLVAGSLQRLEAMTAAKDSCSPPCGFAVGKRWTDEHRRAFGLAYGRLTSAGYGLEAALSEMAAAGWAKHSATLRKRITEANKAASRHRKSQPPLSA